jgi:uncharacterized protein with HEPN domain
MRDEALYLQDIIDAADGIAVILKDSGKDGYEKSDTIRSAVLLKLLFIGEAAANLSTDFRSKHPEIEWSDVVAFRNYAIHAYFSVDWDRVWDSAAVDAPLLRDKVSDILFWEFPETQTND